MKKHLIVCALLISLAGSWSCKGKNDNKGTETTTTTAPEPTNTAPVVVNADDELRNGVKDATKDFPGVEATVDDGVITLTGTIQKDRYPTLKQSLDALRPKQVVNNLKYN
jgi:predicted methyltransferase